MEIGHDPIRLSFWKPIEPEKSDSLDGSDVGSMRKDWGMWLQAREW